MLQRETGNHMLFSVVEVQIIEIDGILKNFLFTSLRSKEKLKLHQQENAECPLHEYETVLSQEV